MLVALGLAVCAGTLTAQEFVVDGDPAEWGQLEPVYADGRDLAEDSEMLGFDMDAVYTAVSEGRRYVYIRLLDDWPFTSGAGAIDWKFIVDTDGDEGEDFRIQKYDRWVLYLPEGDDAFAHRHRLSGIEYQRVGTTAEFSFPATADPLEESSPSFRFTGSDFRWIITTNQQQDELDGIGYFAPGP